MQYKFYATAWHSESYWHNIHKYYEMIAFTVCIISCIFQISMSVQLAMVVVARSVPIQLDHFSVAAAVATDWPVMEELVKTSMNAPLTLVTASRAASILLGDSGVNATLDYNSTLISGHVLVS